MRPVRVRNRPFRTDRGAWTLWGAGPGPAAIRPERSETEQTEGGRPGGNKRGVELRAQVQGSSA